MVQPQYSPQEALERVKLMMKYDTSKTLNENKELISEEYHWLLPNGTITAGSALLGKIPKGAKSFSSLAAARAAAAGSGLSMAGVGAAAVTALPWIAGAAVVGGLGYWLYDSINNGMPTAAKVEAFFNSCSSQSKNLKQVASDSEIVSAAESINTAIEGLQTDEDAIKSAIESMGNVADLCALKTKYDARYGSLYEDLDGDIDGTDWKTYVWAPMQTIIENSAQKLEEVKPKKQGGGGKGGYKPCSGNYTIGCMSEVIKQVQGCLSLVQDGKYGKKTKAALASVGFPNGFTDADVEKICKTSNPQKKEVNPWGESPDTIDSKVNNENNPNTDNKLNNYTTPPVDGSLPGIPDGDNLKGF